MKALEEIIELLSEHLDTNDDTAYSDRGLLIKLRDIASQKLEEEKLSTAEVGIDNAQPSTVYEVVMASMDPAKFAKYGVKLISVNNRELYWVTSMGQLYDFIDYDKALQAEYSWLTTETNR